MNIKPVTYLPGEDPRINMLEKMIGDYQIRINQLEEELNHYRGHHDCDCDREDALE